MTTINEDVLAKGKVTAQPEKVSKFTITIQ